MQTQYPLPNSNKMKHGQKKNHMTFTRPVAEALEKVTSDAFKSVQAFNASAIWRKMQLFFLLVLTKNNFSSTQ